MFMGNLKDVKNLLVFIMLTGAVSSLFSAERSFVARRSGGYSKAINTPVLFQSSITQLAVASSFGPESATITNRYNPLIVGAKFVYKGTGGYAGKSAVYQVLGVERVDGVSCVKVKYTDIYGTSDEWLAQDTLGAVWRLRQHNIISTVYPLPEYDEEDYLEMPADPTVGDSYTIWIDEMKVMSVTEQVSVPLKTYFGCLFMQCTDFGCEDEQSYYAPRIGPIMGHDSDGGWELSSLTGMSDLLLSQRITFPALRVKALGDADFDPGARVSSGLAVTYSSSEPSVAIIVDGNIRVVGAGASVITASRPGNDYFKTAIPVTQKLTVKARVSESVPSGGGGVLGLGLYTLGYKVALTAKPLAGYTFLRWEDGSQAAARTLPMPGSNVTVGAWFGLKSTVLSPVVMVPESQRGMMGVPFTLPLEVTSASLPTVTVSGLPSGLSYNAAARSIKGVPSAAVSNKLVTVTVRNVNPAPTVRTFYMTIDPLPAWASGSFNGFVTHDILGGGAGTMSVTPLGSVSGKFMLRGTNFAFSAKSYATREEDGTFTLVTTAKVGKVAWPMTITVGVPPPTDPVVPQTLSAVRGELADSGGLTLTLYRNIWKDQGMVSVLTNGPAGYYTATLPGGDGYGSGYLAFTVDKLGGVKSAGKLADGTAVSFTGTLVLDEAGRLWTVLYTAPAAYKGGGLFGVAEFSRSDTGAMGLSPYNSSPFVWDNLNSLSPQFIAESGHPRILGLQGGYYNTMMSLGNAYYNSMLEWGIDGQVVPIIENNGVLSVPFGMPATFSVNKATGIFKGKLTITNDVGVAVSLAHEGVLTSSTAEIAVGERLGGGFAKGTGVDSLWVEISKGDGSDKIGTGKILQDLGTWGKTLRSTEAQSGTWETGRLGSLKNQFSAVLQKSPTDYSARIGRAFTTLSVLGEDRDLIDLLGKFGYAFDHDLLTFTGDLAIDSNTPLSNDAIDLLSGKIEPQLQAAFADLTAVPETWAGILVVDPSEFPVDERVTLDRADILYMRALLNALLGFVNAVQAYDLTLDYGKLTLTNAIPSATSDITLDGDESDWQTIPGMNDAEGWDGRIAYTKIAERDGHVYAMIRLAEDDITTDFTQLVFEYNDAGGSGSFVWDSPIPEGSIIEPSWDWGAWNWNPLIGKPSAVAFRNGLLIEIKLSPASGQSSLGIHSYRFSALFEYPPGFNTPWYMRSQMDETSWVNFTKSPAQLLREHTNVLSKVRASAKLTTALTFMKNACALALKADVAVLARKNDGVMHFFEYNIENEDDKAVHVDAISRLKCVQNSLNGSVQKFYLDTFNGGEKDFLQIKLSSFFSAPYLTRDLLPEITESGAIFVDSLRDPTFKGVLPAMTKNNAWLLLADGVATAQKAVFSSNRLTLLNPSSLAVWQCDPGTGNIYAELGTEDSSSRLATTITGPGVLSFNAQVENPSIIECRLDLYVNGLKRDTVFFDSKRCSVTLPPGNNDVSWSLVYSYGKGLPVSVTLSDFSFAE